MDLKIDDIVKQVLSEVGTHKENRTAFTLERMPVFTGNETGKSAVLVSPESYELKEYKLPEIGAKEILVEVEGCCVSPSDTIEFMKEKRVGQASLLGQQGTGRIVKLGSPSLQDAAGVPLKIGDRVTSVKRAGGAASAYGGNRSNTGAGPTGWFSNYVVLRADNQIYQVNDLDLESRLLTETVIAVNSAVQRTAKLGHLDSSKRVIVLGCGLEGLTAIAILNCMGIYNIIAIDGEEGSLKQAREFGARETIDYRDKKGIQAVMEKIKKYFGGSLADAVFQCTASPLGRSTAKRFAKNSGSICELEYVLGKPKTAVRHYEDSMPSGGRYYTSRDYQECFELLKKAAQKEIPLYRLITHRYRLEEINEAHWSAIRGEGLAIAVFNR
ncbi:MAG: zinc-binding dehydrogenase [Clostridium sp.]